MSDSDLWDELVVHLERSTGLPGPIARRVVDEVVAYTDETVDAYLRRRHRELQAAGRANAAIFSLLAAEVTARPFAAGPLSERQIRRAIYG